MSDIERTIDQQWAEHEASGMNPSQMKRGLAKAHAMFHQQTVDLLTKKTKSHVGLPNMAEAFNQAEDNKS
jgi:hypothetical protein